MSPPRILIIGASVAGPTLASFLLLSAEPTSAQLPQITILERASILRTVGQNIDVRGAGVTILRKLGALAAVKAHTTEEAGVQFVDSFNKVWAQIDADRTGETSTPTADIEILRGRLATILIDRMRSISQEVEASGGRGIEEIWGDSVSEIEQDETNGKVKIRFTKTGAWREFDIVVGADGLQSSTRKTVWGINSDKDRVRRLHMYGGFFSIPKGKTDTEYRRWFHASGRRAIMVRPDDTGMRTTVFMYVISETDERLPSAAGRGNLDTQKALMAEYFADAGWESTRVIDEMMKTEDFYYDLIGQVKMDAWSKGRVVLLGDAGYCASPISGMGTTLAISGAYNLAGAIMQHPQNVDAAFKQYRDTMLPVVAKAQKLAPGQPYLMNPETSWGIWVLNSIMYLISVTGIVQLLFKLGAGPPAHSVPVTEYGFRQVSDLSRDGRQKV